MGGWGSGVFNPLVYCWLCVLNLMVFYLGCKVSCCWGISWATPVPYSAPSLGFIFSVSTAHLPLPISTLEEAYELSPVQNWSPHLRPPRHSSCSTHYCGIFCHWHRTIILSIADPRISWGGVVLLCCPRESEVTTMDGWVQEESRASHNHMVAKYIMDKAWWSLHSMQHNLRGT